MNLLTIKILVIFVSFAFICCTAAQELGNGPVENKEQSINEEAAIGYALQYTGFHNVKNYSQIKSQITVQRTIFADTIMNFSDTTKNNRDSWLVRFKNIAINDETDKDIQNVPYPDEFFVYIDYKTGSLLKIESNFVESERPITKHWSKELIDSISSTPNIPGQFSRFTGEQIGLSFYEILNINRNGEPLKARQYIAYYILYSHPTLKPSPEPAWYLVLRENPMPFIQTDPMHFKKKEKAIAVNLIIFDAVTGNIVFSKLRTFPD